MGLSVLCMLYAEQVFGCVQMCLGVFTMQATSVVADTACTGRVEQLARVARQYDQEGIVLPEAAAVGELVYKVILVVAGRWFRA